MTTESLPRPRPTTLERSEVYEPVGRPSSSLSMAGTPQRRAARSGDAPSSILTRLVRNRWMFVPIGLLTVSVTVASTTVALAVAGHPLGVEPDYYAKGAAWDAHRQQQATNDKLRWNVAPEVVATERGTPALRIEIRDKYAGIIDADAVEVEAIPVAIADLRETGPMGRLAPGRFERELTAKVPGQWEFRVRITMGEQVYTDTFRRLLSFAPGRTAVPKPTEVRP